MAGSNIQPGHPGRSPVRFIFRKRVFCAVYRESFRGRDIFTPFAFVPPG